MDDNAISPYLQRWQPQPLPQHCRSTKQIICRAWCLKMRPSIKMAGSHLIAVSDTPANAMPTLQLPARLLRIQSDSRRIACAESIVMQEHSNQQQWLAYSLHCIAGSRCACCRTVHRGKACQSRKS